MRIMTGALAPFASSAGIVIDTAPAPLLPKPPPQYCEIKTTSAGGMPTQRATLSTVRIRLCVEP
jgi:hypothetical protein